MERTAIISLLIYLPLVFKRAMTWPYNQDIIKMAGILKNQYYSRMLVSKTYTNMVWFYRIRYIALIIVATSNIWVAIGCLITEWIAKFLYYAHRAGKPICSMSIQEMLYSLEVHRLRHGDFINNPTDVKMQFMYFYRDFTASFAPSDYNAYWVKDYNGVHIVQTLDEHKETICIDGAAYKSNIKELGRLQSNNICETIQMTDVNMLTIK